MASLTINLKRASKVYHEGETISGVVVIESSSELKHEGLALTLEGVASVAAARPAGLLDALTNATNTKSVTIAQTSLTALGAGRLPVGGARVPFEVPLRARTPLLESYHGVFVSVRYELRAELRARALPLFTRALTASSPVFVQHAPGSPVPPRPVRCEISDGTVRAAGGGSGGGRLPRFLLYCELASAVCALDRPLSGKLRVEHCSVPIKSIEMQLVRVETCGETSSRDATEIQNIQVGEGDPLRGRPLSLHMVLPRLFTCPTTTTPHFKIEFELNIAIIFEDDYLVTENFPILLVRSR